MSHKNSVILICSINSTCSWCVCIITLQGGLSLISALKSDVHHECFRLFLFPPEQFGKGLKMGTVYKSCQPYLRQNTRWSREKKITNEFGSFSCALSKHPGKWKWSHPSSSFQFPNARRYGFFGVGDWVSFFLFFFWLTTNITARAHCLPWIGLLVVAVPLPTAHAMKMKVATARARWCWSQTQLPAGGRHNAR